MLDIAVKYGVVYGGIVEDLPTIGIDVELADIILQAYVFNDYVYG